MKKRILKKVNIYLTLLILLINLTGCEFSEVDNDFEPIQQNQSISSTDINTIQVDEITFNHNTANYIHDAINIRASAQKAIIPPEYVRRRVVNYPAAYVSGTQPVIKVRFSTSIKSKYSIKIKGKCVDNTGILGSTNREKVTFVNGLSDEILFNIDKITPWDVRSGNVTWKWVAISKDGTRSFDYTTHKIYNLLEIPAEPWEQTWLSKKNPWADALEIASNWISRYSGTEVEYVSEDLHIVKAITKGIYLYWGKTKKKVYSYDKKDGVSHYWGRDKLIPSLVWGYAKFNLSVVIDPSTKKLDCTDVSGVVCSLSRLMGVRDVYLKQISVSLKRFWYKPIIPIGRDNWEGLEANTDDIKETWTGHQVVTYKDEIYDGCVAVDPDNPMHITPPVTIVPGNWIIPAGIPENEYRYYIYWENIKGSAKWFYNKYDLNIDVY